MSEENNVVSAPDAGSAANGPVNPNDAPTGEPSSNNEGAPKNEIDEIKTQYQEAEKKLGEQGRELGEYRTFFEGLSPILDKLDKNPELVDAITNDKIDAKLIKAVAEGKVTIGDAKTVTEAQKEVKKDLGKKYENLSPEKLEDLVTSKVEEITKGLKNDFKEDREIRDYQSKIQDFVGKTPDFEKYAKQINSWLDKHEDVTDIEVAYYAVKGQLSEDEAKKKAEVDAAESAKKLAGNAAGGSSQGGQIPEGGSAIDNFIASDYNPNSI